MSSLQPGDPVVYQKTKFGTRPGRRAQATEPSHGGDGYSYVIDKYWRVKSIQDAELTLVTRTGKIHQIPINDPNLRPANLMERIFLRNRFPAREQ